MILLDRVTKIYGKDGKPAINRASLHIEPKEFVIIVGTSGAGKSTLLKLLTREEKPTSGKIVVGGNVVQTTSDFAVARYNVNGSLDNSFDVDGKVTIDRNGNTDVAGGLQLYENRIYIGGYTYPPTGATNFALVALKNDVTTALVDVLPGKEPMIYPVPATDEVHIVMKEKEEVLYQLTDVSGRTLRKETIRTNNNSAQTISIHDLAPGIYYLHITGRKMDFVKTLIKQ